MFGFHRNGLSYLSEPCYKETILQNNYWNHKMVIILTGACIYEYLLPCPMLRGLLFDSIQNFEKITVNEKLKFFTKVIHRKSKGWAQKYSRS